jgi:hypothetical protein
LKQCKPGSLLGTIMGSIDSRFGTAMNAPPTSLTLAIAQELRRLDCQEDPDYSRVSELIDMSRPPSCWPLHEALSRTTGLEGSDDSRLWSMIEAGALIAYGRRHAAADREWIPPSTCRALIDRDLQGSCARGATGRFTDIAIYPVVNAPNAPDILNGMLLKHAFWQFVLGDPEVKFLGKKAVAVKPQLERVYAFGFADPYENVDWCVEEGLSENCHDWDDPRAFGYVQQAAGAISRRFTQLMSLLRDQRLEALGDSGGSYGTYKILPSIWSHRSYFFDSYTGDLDGESRRCKGVKRWSAVMLNKPDQHQTFHVKPTTFDQTAPPTIELSLPEFVRGLTPAQASVHQAINGKWPNGMPPGLGVKKKGRLIREWQAEKGLTITSDKTIYRYLKELEKRRD